MTLELRNISKRFDDVSAVEHVSLSLPDGEFAAFLGASGCGKTTLLRMIAGLEAPSEGVILLDNQDITPLPARARNMGLVFQNYALFPHMNIENNIHFGLRMRNVPPQEANARFANIVDVTGLGGVLTRFPHQLSGGQRQRVAIARTLVTKPEILMLDEPFANLDSTLRTEMRQFLKQLHEDLKMTVIFVTHDQSEAMELASRIALFQHGRLLQCDAPEALYNQPNSLAAANYLGIENIIPAHWKGQYFETPIGALHAPAPANTDGTFVIRADRLSLHKTEGPNRFHAQILAQQFLGAERLLKLRIGDERFTLRAPSHIAIDESANYCEFPTSALHFIPNS